MKKINKNNLLYSSDNGEWAILYLSNYRNVDEMFESLDWLEKNNFKLHIQYDDSTIFKKIK